MRLVNDAPRAGGPAVRVTHGDPRLQELTFVAAYYSIGSASFLPPIQNSSRVRIPGGTNSGEEFAARWNHLWSLSVEWFEWRMDAVVDAVKSADAATWQSADDLVPPRWRDLEGARFPEEAFADWDESVGADTAWIPPFHAPQVRPHVFAAAERGLHDIVVLPVTTSWWHDTGGGVVLISPELGHDASALERRLRAFGEGGSE